MQRAAIDNKYPNVDKYILVKTLGIGYNSKVKLGFDTTSINNYVAVKIIKHSTPNLDLDAILNQTGILGTLKHPNIVKVIEYHESVDYVKKNGQTYKVVAIVMEYLSGGELFDHIIQSQRLSEDNARTYFKVLIKAVCFCHQKGITHRHLKLENLVFDDDFNLKVTSFGFATLIAGRHGDNQLHTIVGTESYMAPEIHARQPYSGVSVDLFACGIILFIMVSGNPPFSKADPIRDPHYNLFNTRKEIFWRSHERNKPRREGQETFFSAEFRDLLNSMLALNPNRRLSIEQIEAHPWVQG